MQLAPRRTLPAALLAVACLAAPAWSQDNSVGLGVGFVDPEAVDGTLWFTGNVNIKVANQLVVQPELGYWSKTEKIPALVEASVKDFNVGANLLFVPVTTSALDVGIGAGVGAHFLKGEVGVADVFSESESETKFGVHLLGTVGYKVTGGFQVFAALRFDLVSDINQFKVYGGVRFKI
jgi:hypothetical protein